MYVNSFVLLNIIMDTLEKYINNINKTGNKHYVLEKYLIEKEGLNDKGDGSDSDGQREDDQWD